MLYHAEVKWPKRIKNLLPFGVRELRYSGHALSASQDDRYGQMELPQQVNMADVYVFEAEEIRRGQLTKVVFRVEYNERLDMVVAAIPERGGLFVKTVWFNERRDNHKTLDRSKYQR